MAANKRRENELKTPKLTPVKETIGTIDRLVNFKISATTSSIINLDKMLTKQELSNLLDGVLKPDTLDDQTFDRCMQKFSQSFQKTDWFNVCTSLCYLIEAQVTKSPVLTFKATAKELEISSILHSLRSVSSRANS